MKYLIYEDPDTHKFTFVPLPSRFVEGDVLPAVATDQWFDNHEAALTALPELFTRDEFEPAARVDDATGAEHIQVRIDPRRMH